MNPTNPILVCPLFCEHRVDHIVGTIWIQAPTPLDAQARGTDLMKQLIGRPEWGRNQ